MLPWGWGGEGRARKTRRQCDQDESKEPMSECLLRSGTPGVCTPLPILLVHTIVDGIREETSGQTGAASGSCRMVGEEIHSVTPARHG
jgi:hypothetical protein